MADTPQLAPLGGPSGDRLDYKPLSGHAVAAIVLSGLFGVLIVVLGTVAFLTKKPLLAGELLGLAAAGLFFAVMGRSQIKRSSGARLGLGLCNAAWWISVLGGLGFAMYLLGGENALQKQSESEGRRFLEYLEQGKANHAFLMTLEPGRRGGLNPEAGAQLEAEFGKGQLAAFRQGEVVGLFERLAPNKEITFSSAGMKSWTNSSAGYDVFQGYRFLTPEGVYELTLGLTGREGANIRGRQWAIKQIPGENVLAWTKRTRYGRVWNEALTEAYSVGRVFLELGGERAQESMYTLTLPTEAREGYQAGLTARGLLTGGTIPGMPVPAKAHPEWASKFFKPRTQGPTADDPRKFLEAAWDNGLIRPAGFDRMVVNVDKRTRVTATDDKFQLEFPVEISSPRGTSAGRLLIQATNPAFLAEAAKLRKEGWADPTKEDKEPGSVIKSLPTRGWRVMSLESDLEPLPAAQRGDGPGG